MQSYEALALFERLMACETLDEIDAVFGEYDEDALNALMAELTPEQQEAVHAHIGGLAEIPLAPGEEFIPPVDFTKAAPFLPPVKGEAMRGLRSMLNSEPDPKDALKLNKTAKANDGTYTVTLEAYTTGKVTSTTTNIPTDIVLVLDQSGSMARCMEHGQTVEHGLGTYSQFDGPYSIDGTYYLKNNDTKYTQIYYCDGTSIDHETSGNKHVEGWYSSTNHNKGQYLNTQPTEIYIQDTCTSESRLAALKTAANGFAVEVAAKASANDVNNCIAVVGFAGAASSSYTNTGLFDGSSFTKYDSITDDQYQAALKNMNTSEGVGSVTASINNLAASGATSTDLGVIMANNIFENNTVVGERNRVVIVFTDGVPTTQTAFDMGVANSAITAAGITKNTHKATVYAIGVFNGADPTSAGSASGTTETEKANWFMQNLSSNNGVVQTPSFYLSASNAGALNSIFQAISSNITSPDIELGASTQIRDTISPYFKLKADSLKAYTVDSTGGENFSEDRVELNSATTEKGLHSQALILTRTLYQPPQNLIRLMTMVGS